ncbi:hypothetical protein RhiirC2_350959 [Rhizophagus irregularis]|uniref:Uncharacterized protein n=1 Tax=Rhizophagus irregularis TaxID=588596 RepID=A0A2N1NH31_9GLOM|nr:hypothetical protein RhiirC2_350959 [Rhizophagus irregularis]
MFTKSCHSCHYTLYELRNACISLTFFLSPGIPNMITWWLHHQDFSRIKLDCQFYFLFFV